MPDPVIDVLDIRNVSNTPLQIGVGPPDEGFLLGTDITPFDGSFLYDGSGIVKLMPGKRLIIEEYRVNLGQIQNYIDSGMAQVLFQKRLFSAITDIS